MFRIAVSRYGKRPLFHFFLCFLCYQSYMTAHNFVCKIMAIRVFKITAKKRLAIESVVNTDKLPKMLDFLSMIWQCRNYMLTRPQSAGALPFGHLEDALSDLPHSSSVLWPLLALWLALVFCIPCNTLPSL